MSESTRKQSLLGQAWLVLLLSLCFGGALAGVEIGLKERIAENKRKETFDQIPVLVPGASGGKSREEAVAGKRAFKAFDEAGTHRGWVVPAAGQGVADRIELLIGLDAPLERITGIYVLDQKETPGLGDFITSQEKFRSWFEGQPATAPLEVVKARPAPGQGRILALTGATISSMSVAEIVNRAVRTFKADLQAQGGGE